jgi:DNA processing protein
MSHEPPAAPGDGAPDETELLDLLCLTMVPGVGPATFQALMERFGSATRALSATEGRLREVSGVGPKLATAITRARRDFNPEAERELCRQKGVEIVGRGAPGYPEPLERIPDPPPLLYCKGTLTPGDELAIAIVGSRKCTPYGLRTAERLAQSLARVGLTVVSGLARGIDASAHRGALKAGGRTIGVLANGLAEIYPPEHDELADQVADSGAVVSEMPMRQRPLADLFPRRNRIISGLCLGVVVVEATPRSGSLVTARHALEQNREVFAVPGPVDSLPSRGCHQLIRDGARLVETVDDILEELGPLVREVKPSDDGVPVRKPSELALSDQERTILGHLDDVPKGVDEIIGRTRQTASQVMATLSVLEMRRLIRRMPGNAFVRL